MGLNGLKSLLTEHPELGEQLKEQVNAAQPATATNGDDPTGSKDSKLLK
jgi:hypothetical protein